MHVGNPPHPGHFIRTEIIEPAGLPVTDAARILHVSRLALSSLLNAKADLSGEMALRIEKAFGIRMDTLMRMQSSYDIARTRKREKTLCVKRFQAPVSLVLPHALSERSEGTSGIILGSFASRYCGMDLSFVIPAEAGIHQERRRRDITCAMDPRLRGDDNNKMMKMDYLQLD